MLEAGNDTTSTLLRNFGKVDANGLEFKSQEVGASK